MCWSLFLIKLQVLRLATVLKRDAKTTVFLRILETLRTPISKNICERLLLIVVTYRIENWIKLFRNQISLLLLLKHKITLFHLLSFVLLRFIPRCHSLTLIVIFCYSLSFVVTCCTTCCHSLLLVATRCHSLYNRCHSLSLVVPIVSLLINDPTSLSYVSFFFND